MRRERIYQGKIVGPDGTEIQGSVWSNGTVVIVFRAPWNTPIATLYDPTVEMDGTLLVVSGTEADRGVVERYQATAPEQTLLNWISVDVTFPGGEKVEKATVKVTNYRATILKNGMAPREYVGATVAQFAGKRTITTITGEQITVETGRGCGCGGRR